VEPFIIAAIIFGVASGVAGSSFYYRRNRRIRRRMRKAPFKRLHLINDGEIVTTAGNVLYFKRHMTAPLSGRECVYYHITVERKKSSGKSSKWVKEIDEASCVDFILDDGTSIAIVEASAIEGFLEMDKNYRSGTFNDATRIMNDFLAKYNYKSTAMFGINKTLRYKEGAMEKHEYVIVSGQCQWEAAADYEIEDREQVLVIRGTRERPLYISDVKDILV
jgi:hypothetical protein